MSDNRKIIKGAGIVASATAISRVFGLLRDIIIARFFGAGIATDAFFVAFRIPNMLRRLFAEGAMTVSFIPIFKDAELRGGKAEAREVFDIVFTFLSMVVAVVVVAGILFAPYIIKLIAPGFSDLYQHELTVYLSRVIFPYIFLICLVALAMGVLNSLGRFAAPAAAPILLNISIILMSVFISPLMDEPVESLALGVILGGILQVVLQVPFLLKEGYMPRINLNFSHPALKRILSLMGPALFGIAVYQINIFVTTILASFLPEGSVSYLYYADRLFQLPLGIFVISMATALLPTMSEQVVSGRVDKMKHSLSFSLKIVSFITLPASAGLFAVSVPVFSLFFQRGEFDYLSTLKTANALQFYVLGLWAIGGVKIVVPAFYSLKDMKTPVWAAAGAFVVNVAFSLLLMGPLLHGGLALATTLSSVLNLGILLYVIRGRVGRVIDKSLVVSFLKSLVGAILTGLVAYRISLFGNWEADGINSEKCLVLLLAIVAGALVYFASAFLLRSEEAGYVLKALKGGRRGGGKL